jgi:hypothetical protein
MGLDMYVLKTSQAIPTEVDFDFEVDDFELVHRWRKHPNLHGWMEALYRSKGGVEDYFNCVNVALTDEDLDKLEQAIRNDNLPETDGFFFGESDGSEKDDDLQFLDAARAALAEGKRIFYRSWW